MELEERLSSVEAMGGDDATDVAAGGEWVMVAGGKEKANGREALGAMNTLACGD